MKEILEITMMEEEFVLGKEVKEKSRKERSVDGKERQEDKKRWREKGVEEEEGGP